MPERCFTRQMPRWADMQETYRGLAWEGKEEGQGTWDMTVKGEEAGPGSSEEVMAQLMGGLPRAGRLGLVPLGSVLLRAAWETYGLVSFLW